MYSVEYARIMAGVRSIPTICGFDGTLLSTTAVPVVVAVRSEGSRMLE
jgi:hypothetical protein